MSATLFISFDRKVRALNPNEVDRLLLVDVVTEVDPLARKLKVRPLSSFISYDAKQAVIGWIDNPEERKRVIAAAPPVEWFDSADGVKSVRAFRQHFEIAPKDIPGKARKFGDSLIEELLEVEQLLLKAAKKKLRFRWYIVL